MHSPHQNPQNCAIVQGSCTTKTTIHCIHVICSNLAIVEILQLVQSSWISCLWLVAVLFFLFQSMRCSFYFPCLSIFINLSCESSLVCINNDCIVCSLWFSAVPKTRARTAHKKYFLFLSQSVPFHFWAWKNNKVHWFHSYQLHFHQTSTRWQCCIGHDGEHHVPIMQYN